MNDLRQIPVPSNTLMKSPRIWPCRPPPPHRGAPGYARSLMMEPVKWAEYRIFYDDA
jgi:hypothetical protein